MAWVVPPQRGWPSSTRGMGSGHGKRRRACPWASIQVGSLRQLYELSSTFDGDFFICVFTCGDKLVLDAQVRTRTVGMPMPFLKSKYTSVLMFMSTLFLFIHFVSVCF